jgi:hypothetical protein
VRRKWLELFGRVAGVPIREYCYYEVQNIDSSPTSINFAKDRIWLSNFVAALVPDFLEGNLRNTCGLRQANGPLSVCNRFFIS